MLSSYLSDERFSLYPAGGNYVCLFNQCVSYSAYTSMQSGHVPVSGIT